MRHIIEKNPFLFYGLLLALISNGFLLTWLSNKFIPFFYLVGIGICFFYLVFAKCTICMLHDRLCINLNKIFIREQRWHQFKISDWLKAGILWQFFLLMPIVYFIFSFVLVSYQTFGRVSFSNISYFLFVLYIFFYVVLQFLVLFLQNISNKTCPWW